MGNDREQLEALRDALGIDGTEINDDPQFGELELLVPLPGGQPVYVTTRPPGHDPGWILFCDDDFELDGQIIGYAADGAEPAAAVLRAWLNLPQPSSPARLAILALAVLAVVVAAGVLALAFARWNGAV